MYGELTPVGGGDPIPLLKKKLLIGRREGCDIVLRFPNVSSKHCELTLTSGYWFVKDLQSSNGVKVNGVKVTDKRVDPGDTLSVAKHSYTLRYVPSDLGAIGPPPPDTGGVQAADVFKKSLLERAGIKGKNMPGKDDGPRKYDPTNMDAGQIKRPDKPV
jgi:predicted component of type VI protein secretion system